MESRYEIVMIEEDLLGDPSSISDCPMVRAVKRNVPNAEDVTCGYIHIRMGDRPRWKFALPPEALKLQLNLMNGLRALPITFTMEKAK